MPVDLAVTIGLAIRSVHTGLGHPLPLLVAFGARQSRTRAPPPHLSRAPSLSCYGYAPGRRLGPGGPAPDEAQPPGYYNRHLRVDAHRHGRRRHRGFGEGLVGRRWHGRTDRRLRLPRSWLFSSHDVDMGKLRPRRSHRSSRRFKSGHLHQTGQARTIGTITVVAVLAFRPQGSDDVVGDQRRHGIG